VPSLATDAEEPEVLFVGIAMERDGVDASTVMVMDLCLIPVGIKKDAFIASIQRMDMDNK